MTWSAGSGPPCVPGCRRGTFPTRSTRCPASRGRCPARSSRCRSGRSCWACRSPRRPTGTRWPTPRCWPPSFLGPQGRASEGRRRERAGSRVTRPTSEQRPGTGRSFGEEGGRLTYGSYLRLPELLAQQVRQVVPPAHDELLFITVHQAYELWFQQLLHELTAVRDLMLDGSAPDTSSRPDTPAPQTSLWKARQLLGRAHVIERLLISQVDVLETMTPQDFLDFRAALAPASGFQSVQFRELEFLSGLKDPAFVARFRALTGDERARLARRLAEPSLWEAYLAVLASRGLAVGDDKQILAS